MNLLDTTSDDKDSPRFVTKKLIKVFYQSEGNYTFIKEIRIKAPILRAGLYDYCDAYIAMKGTITVIIRPNNVKRNKRTAFRNNPPFISSISKINDILIDNSEDLDVEMAM